MHELSVIKALIEAVDIYKRAEKGREITAIKIEVGSMTCADPERLMFCFDMVRNDVGLGKVQLRIQPVIATVRCLSCGTEYEISKVGEPCQCGSYQHNMLSGDELNLTEIEFA
jgi:hydrogenase nickel incorporation protein HypA/HybF